MAKDLPRGERIALPAEFFQGADGVFPSAGHFWPPAGALPLQGRVTFFWGLILPERGKFVYSGLGYGDGSECAMDDGVGGLREAVPNAPGAGVQSARKAAIRLLRGIAKGARISPDANTPGVVSLSSLALTKPEARHQLLMNVDTLLQSGGPGLQQLIAQQIPKNGPDALKRMERAENVLLATLASLPPSGREAAMQDPERLQALCKNAIFGSLVSKNDKICAICAGNVRKSASYTAMAELPEAMRPLAHQSAQRLEMLLARAPNLSEEQREVIRGRAMDFFRATKCEGDLMTFPLSFAGRPDRPAQAHIGSGWTDMRHLGYLLKSLGEETYGQFHIPDQVCMQHRHGGDADGDMTLNEWLRRGAKAEDAGEDAGKITHIPTEMAGEASRVEEEATVKDTSAGANAGEKSVLAEGHATGIQLEEAPELVTPELAPAPKLDPAPEIPPLAAGLAGIFEGINPQQLEGLQQLDTAQLALCLGGEAHPGEAVALADLARALVGMRAPMVDVPDPSALLTAGGTPGPGLDPEIRTALTDLMKALSDLHSAPAAGDTAAAGRQTALRSAFGRFRAALHSKLAHISLARPGDPALGQALKDIEDALQKFRDMPVPGAAAPAGRPTNMKEVILRKVAPSGPKTFAGGVATQAQKSLNALRGILHGPSLDGARAARELMADLKGNPELAAELARQDVKTTGDRVLQKLVDGQPEFRAFVNDNPAIREAFTRAGITGLKA